MKKEAIYVKHKLNAIGSTERKISQCREFAKERQLEVVHVYCDEVKDSTQKRYNFESLLKDCKKHLFDCVIVTSTANLTRKPYEICKVYKALKENSIGLYSVLDNDEIIAANKGESK